jgi:hypothetical protein
MKKLLITGVAFFLIFNATAQMKPADTVVVALAKTSKVVFTMQDRSDLPLLKQYDYQALFNDIFTKLEKNETIYSPTDTVKQDSQTTNEPVTWEDDDDKPTWRDTKHKSHRHRGTRHYFNFDLGTNNYTTNGKFPDADDEQHAVRPWGSWYVGVNSVQRTHVGGKFFVEWGLGVSWYNFKFQDDATRLVQDVDDVKGVTFEKDPRDADVSFIKSKLTVSYIHASLVPMIDVGGHNRKARFWDSHNSSFRFGVGPYAGYRIGSHTKQVYKEDGDREKDKDRDNFYLNNFRYGVRMQLGIRSADFFFNYDLNELFATNRGPKLNAFSFGVIF